MSQYSIDVTETTFTTEVESGALPILIDFWAPSCAPCRQLAPLFEELAQLYQGRIRFAKINVDGNRALAKRFGVLGIPALLLFKNGELVAQTRGLQSRTTLAKLLDEHINEKPLLPIKPQHAFLGDGELKRRVVNQVRTHLEADQVRIRLPGSVYVYTGPVYDEATGQCSVIGAVLHGTDMADYESALGIPASAAILEDFVHGCLMRRPTDAHGVYGTFYGPMRDHPLEWLERIPPGADLRKLTSHFLSWFLLELIDAPPVLPFNTIAADDIKPAVRDVAMLHNRLANGDAPTASEWAAASEATGKASNDYRQEAFTDAVTLCAKILSRPSEDNGFVAPDGLTAFCYPLYASAVRHGHSAETYGRLEQLWLALGEHWHYGLMRALAKTAS